MPHFVALAQTVGPYVAVNYLTFLGALPLAGDENPIILFLAKTRLTLTIWSTSSTTVGLSCSQTDKQMKERPRAHNLLCCRR